MRLGFSPTAIDDLLAIGVYIAGDNPERALTFVDELEAQCLRLTEAPEKGVRREELLIGLRLWPYRAYNKFYRIDEREVLVVRVLHSSLNAQASDLQ